MKIYHYDSETGKYLGEGLADLSPLEQDVWLIPAYATSVEPLEAPDGQYAAFIDNAWSLHEIVEEEVS